MMRVRKYWFVIAAALLVGGVPSIAAFASPPGMVRVVMAGDPGMSALTKAAVLKAGGLWVDDLDVLDGGVADVPADAVGRLRATPGVQSVAVDTTVSLKSAVPLPQASASGSADSKVIRAAMNIEKDDTKADGEGIDIALIDSGVAPVKGLEVKQLLFLSPTTGQLVPGSEAVYDKVGHGTHMAGLLIGKSGGVKGLARGSRVVSANVSDAQGRTSLSLILRAIDATISNSQSNGLNIRVMVMAFGYPPDTIAGRLVMVAAERAVASGIVVVAAAGNGGTTTGKLDAPAASPVVLAVGAADVLSGSPKMPAFSSRGTGRSPDLVAPGVGILSIRDTGSFLDSEFPEARVSKELFRGSGTSQAAALVGGLVAMLLEELPDLTPSMVRARLELTATPIPGVATNEQGAGMVNYGDALDEDDVDFPVNALTVLLRSGTAPAGELDDPNAGDLNGTRWAGTRWAGTRWMGDGWTAA